MQNSDSKWYGPLNGWWAARNRTEIFEAVENDDVEIVSHIYKPFSKANAWNICQVRKVNDDRAIFVRATGIWKEVSSHRRGDIFFVTAVSIPEWHACTKEETSYWREFSTTVSTYILNVFLFLVHVAHKIATSVLSRENSQTWREKRGGIQPALAFQSVRLPSGIVPRVGFHADHFVGKSSHPINKKNKEGNQLLKGIPCTSRSPFCTCDACCDNNRGASNSSEAPYSLGELQYLVQKRIFWGG